MGIASACRESCRASKETSTSIPNDDTLNNQIHDLLRLILIHSQCYAISTCAIRLKMNAPRSPVNMKAL